MLFTQQNGCIRQSLLLVFQFQIGCCQLGFLGSEGLLRRKNNLLLLFQCKRLVSQQPLLLFQLRQRTVQFIFFGQQNQLLSLQFCLLRGKGCTLFIQSGLLYIQRCLLGVQNHLLFFQRGLLLGQRILLERQQCALFIQFCRLGFQHQEILINAVTQEQHKQQKQRGHHIRIADPCGTAIRLACPSARITFAGHSGLLYCASASSC